MLIIVLRRTKNVPADANAVSVLVPNPNELSKGGNKNNALLHSSLQYSSRLQNGINMGNMCHWIWSGGKNFRVIYLYEFFWISKGNGFPVNCIWQCVVPLKVAFFSSVDGRFKRYYDIIRPKQPEKE